MTEPHVMHLAATYPDGGRLYVCLACGRERYVNFNTNPMQTRTITAGEDCLHIAGVCVGAAVSVGEERGKEVLQ